MALKLRQSKKTYLVKVERDGNEATFHVCPETPEEEKKRLERFTVTERKRGRDKEVLNWYEAQLDKVVNVIVAWDGILGEDGQPLPCTRENKIDAYTFNTGIIDEVMREAASLASEASAKAEEALGNSAPSPKRK